MKTYSVNSMGGMLYSGVPSFDVAVSMAVDLCRYEDEDDEGRSSLARSEVKVEEVEECGVTYTLVTSDFQWRGFGIGVENRCDACLRPL